MHIEVESKLQAGRRRVLVYLPTGGGKTVVASHLIQSYCCKLDSMKRRCLFVVNRNALIDQTAVALDKCGFQGEYAFIKSNYPTNSTKPIQIASIQTLTTRAKKTSKKMQNTLQEVQNVEPSSKNNHKSSKCKDSRSGSTSPRKHKGKPWGDFELIILDEAHGAVASQYMELLGVYSTAAVVGLTATPFRLNPKECLGRVFKHAVVGPTVSALIQKKVI